MADIPALQGKKDWNGHMKNILHLRKMDISKVNVM